MSNTKTMLIVDDSRMSRMMIRTIVANSYPDWLLIEASDGNDALEKVADQSIDIMTLDLNMPGMDGIELAEILRPMFPQARISLLTANIQEATRRKAEALGLGFIAKPISEDKILNYLNEIKAA